MKVERYCIAIVHEYKEEPTEVYYVDQYNGYTFTSVRLHDMMRERINPQYFTLDEAVRFIENSTKSMMLGDPMICLAFRIDENGEYHTLRD